MKISHIVFCAVIASAASSAISEDRLFPTDILNKGEFDARFTYEEILRSNRFALPASSGTFKEEHATQFANLRYGIGNDMHVGLSLENASGFQGIAHFDNGTQRAENVSSKWFNPTYYLTYGAIKEAPSNPYAVNLTARISAGSDDTSGSVAVLGSYKFSEDFKSYASYDHLFSGSSSSADVDQIRLGIHKKLFGNTRFTPEFSYRKLASTATTSASSILDYTLAFQTELCQNTYLIPGYTFQKRSDYSIGANNYASIRENNFSLTLYHLF